MRDTGDYCGCGHNGGDYGDGTPYLLDAPSFRPMSDSLVWVKHTLLLLGGRLPQWILAVLLAVVCISVIS